MIKLNNSELLSAIVTLEHPSRILQTDKTNNSSNKDVDNVGRIRFRLFVLCFCFC